MFAQTTRLRHAHGDTFWEVLDRYSTASQQGTNYPKRQHGHGVFRWRGRGQAQGDGVPREGVKQRCLKENHQREWAGPLKAGSCFSYWKSYNYARPHQRWIYYAAFLSKKCLCGAEQSGRSWARSSRTELCSCPAPGALPRARSCLGIFHVGTRNS